MRIGLNSQFSSIVGSQKYLRKCYGLDSQSIISKVSSLIKKITMLKRVIDIFFSGIGLLLFSPLLIIVSIIVFLQDFNNPLYIAPRVGRDRKQFMMVKLRSMIVFADKSGVDSTSQDDKRITWIGKFIRKCKLDEITQLWNVLIGDMSLVGPRPNVQRDVDIYTRKEIHLLDLRHGITDFPR